MDDFDGSGRRRGLSLPVVVLTSLLVSVVAFVGLRAAELRGLLPFLSAPSEDVVVPSITGVQPEQARAILGGRGLRLVLAAERPDPRVAAGLVAGQTPLAGSQLRAGGAVEAWVSAGVAAVVVPQVTGMRREDALRILQDKGLQPGALTAAPSDTVEVGYVSGTQPAAGQAVASGTTVAVFISSGKATKPVPKVIGLSLSRAKKALEGEGFVVGTTKRGYSDNFDDEVVIKQDPAEGAQAAPGSAVNLVINEP